MKKTITELIEIHHKAVQSCGKMARECATNLQMQGFAASSTECCILHIDAEELLKAAGDDARKQQEAREKSKAAISFEKNVRSQTGIKAPIEIKEEYFNEHECPYCMVEKCLLRKFENLINFGFNCHHCGNLIRAEARLESNGFNLLKV